MTNTKEVDHNEKVASIIVNLYENEEAYLKKSITLKEKLYKHYQTMALDKQEELKDAPKLSIKIRNQLKQELKNLQDLADTFYLNYLKDNKQLYELKASFLTPNKQTE